MPQPGPAVLLPLTGRMMMTWLLAGLLLACTVATAVDYTIVPDWNAYEVPPSRHPPKAAGPVKNISSQAICADYCTATPGCVQWAWNYGGKSAHRWYCEISSAGTWTGVPSDHITSGCLASVKDCGKRSPVPAPPPLPPAPAPGPWTPKWSAVLPDKKINSTFGYPLLAPSKATHSYVYYASSTFGTYNHGPMISFWDGFYWMEWYNGVKSEGVEQPRAVRNVDRRNHLVKTTGFVQHNWTDWFGKRAAGPSTNDLSQPSLMNLF